MPPHTRGPRPPEARLCAIVAALLLALPGAAAGQTADGRPVTERLNVLADENAAEYLQPVAAGLGAGLNAGFLQTASTDGGVHVQFGLQVSGSFVPSDADRFEPELPQTLTVEGRTFRDPYRIQGDRTTTPTATGGGSGVVLVPSDSVRQAILAAGEDPSRFEIRFPDGIDLPAVPLAMAEASVSLPTGTAAMLRFFPSIEVNQNVGSVSSFGFGVRQSASPFLDDPPVDLGLALGYQQLSLGDVVDATGRSIDLIASRDLGLITVFASGGLEDTDVDVEYTFENPTDIPGLPADGQTVSLPREGNSFPREGANAGRFTGGVRLDLFVARLSVAYTTANYDVLQARLTFGN